jgi:hypothetical protein
MEFLKRFEVPAKNPSEDAQRRWREAVGTLVKNRRRRFRMVPDLDKRSQVETERRNIQVRPSRPSGEPALQHALFKFVSFSFSPFSFWIGSDQCQLLPRRKAAVLTFSSDRDLWLCSSDDACPWMAMFIIRSVLSVKKTC